MIVKMGKGTVSAGGIRLHNNLLDDAGTRKVFKAVAAPRTIQLRDLETSLSGTDMVKFDLERSIDVLKDADLIKVRPAAIRDFSTIYLTENGLGVAQALKHLGSGFDDTIS